jgi:chromate reductase, NAD(P)H dehydrogenase (quinone)
MILILVATNRNNSMSLKVATYYQKQLQAKETPAEIMNLADLPEDFTFSALYGNSGKNEVFNQFQAKIDSVKKIIFIVPEYNGSFPGVLKTFIDGLRYPDSFRGKKGALVGLSAGVLGNNTGLSHLGDILAYMGCNTLAQRIQLGLVSKHFDGQEFSFDVYKNLINQQIDSFIGF